VNARQLFGEALAAAGDVPAVEWMAHEGLARLAAAAGEPVEAAREFEAAVQTVEQTRSALLRADYRISFASRLITFYRGYVEFLMDQGQVERALEVADASRARVLAERQGVAAASGRVSAPALKALAARTRTTMVFYWLGPDRSWAWRVTGAGVVVQPLPPAAEIERLVAAHRAAIDDTLVDPLASATMPGAQLWNAVVVPVAGHLSRGAAVIVVPDGALHRVSFETLPVPADRPHYWIEDVTVQVAPSLAMLQRATGPMRLAAVGDAAAASPTVLLIGNPTPRAPDFPALSYAAAEMAGVEQPFGAGAVVRIEGAEASPAAFSQAGPERFPVIHFTSHAVANIENPLDSAVILSGPDQAYKLYARDVANARLRAELVTVSACRSAGERAYAGEGLVGFAWAFLRAGSRRVVAGLWDVDDRSTALLMADAYRRMATGTPPAVALREAKLTLIREGFPKPYYWGALQLFTVTV
jgi:CHAT domain-containing protein